MRRTYLFYGLLLLGLTSCHQEDQRSSIDPTDGPTVPIIFLNSEGDTLPTGVPLRLEGRTIAADSLQPPVTFIPGLKNTPVEPAKLFTVDRVKTIPIPTDLPKIEPGQNGIPLPDTIPLEVRTIRVEPPEIVRAAPWSRPNLRTNQFESIDADQGLISISVSNVFEDSRGHYWLGSNKRISRYDGKNFWHYPLSEELGDGVIRFETIAGNLWLQHPRNGSFSRFDGKRLINYQLPANFQEENPRFSQDSKGIIWGMSDSALYRFEENKLVRYNATHGLLADPINGIVFNPKGGIRIFHSTGITFFDGVGFQQFPLRESNIRLGEYRDNEWERVWFSNGDYLCALNQDNIVFYTSELLPAHPISTFLQTGEDTFWASNIFFGVSYFDGRQLQFFEESEGLKGERAKPCLQDSYGRTWFSAPRYGLQRFNRPRFQFPLIGETIKNPMIAAITEDRKGNVWLGALGRSELLKYDGKSFTRFDPFFPGGPYAFRSFFEDSQGNLWLGSRTGVFKWDGKKLTRFAQEEGLSGAQVFAITEDHRGHLWFGLMGKGGLTEYDGAAFTHHHLEALSRADHSTLPITQHPNSIRALLCDRKGNIWIGSLAGLRKYDGLNTTLYTTREGLSSNQILSLYEDQHGTLWIGTEGGGVNTFDGQDFQTITTTDGLSSNTIWTISEDTAGHIWLGADECLNVPRFPEGGLPGRSAPSSVTVYCELDGNLGGQFFANATLRDRQGNMWWGTNKNLIMAPPDLQPVLEPPAPKISELYITQKRLDFGLLADSMNRETLQEAGLSGLRFSEVAPWYNYPLDLKLPFQLNSLTFHFTAEHHPDLEYVRFSHRIPELNEAWSAPDADGKADYRSLPSGTYRLQVRAVGREGIWSEAMEYHFTVLPPWWRSLWAIALWIGALAGSVFLLYRYNLKHQLDKQENRRLKELESLKSRLYTNITHEFRTPLTVIMGMAEQLAAQHEQSQLPVLDKEKFSRGFDLINRNSQNLLRLINQLLDLAKLDAGQLQLNKTRGDVISYLQYLTESFYSMATEKDIRLNFYPETAQLLMDYDEEKLQQIIYNLLSNAVKFTPHNGKIILHVHTVKEAPEAWLQIKVQDTGIGISPEELPHVFNRFYQVDNSTTRAGEGTGIGLALTKELVRLMGGTIQVNSRLGQGTSFTVRLPIANQAPLAGTRSSRESRDISIFPAPHLPANGNGARELPSEPESVDPALPVLLIIEDNPDVVLYIRDILTPGYRILTAENGRLGIEKAIDAIPDIIVSDVMMPEKDGFEVCRTLKTDQRTSHIPIVLLTARAEDKARIEGLQYGADAYLTKPFHKEELQVRLAKLLELRKLLQERYSQTESVSRLTEKEQAAKDQEEVFLHQVREIILSRLDDPDLSIPELAKSIDMNHMQVYRKLKALTGDTPSQFVRSLRLKRATHLLLHSELTIAEIAYQVGFSDPNYFSRTFQSAFGKSPSDFRK